ASRCTTSSAMIAFVVAASISVLSTSLKILSDSSRFAPSAAMIWSVVSCGIGPLAQHNQWLKVAIIECLQRIQSDIHGTEQPVVCVLACLVGNVGNRFQYPSHLG